MAENHTESLSHFCCIQLHARYCLALSQSQHGAASWELVPCAATMVAGQKGLSAAARGSDGRGPSTQLLSYLCDHCTGVTSLADLVRQVHKLTQHTPAHCIWRGQLIRLPALIVAGTAPISAVAQTSAETVVHWKGANAIIVQ